MLKEILTSSGILLACLLCGISCSGNKQQNTEVTECKVAKLDTSTAVIHVDFTAVVQSADVVQISSRVQGYLEKILVKEGALIKKGQPLFKINDADFRQQANAAAAGVGAAEANLGNAKLEVEKLTPLVEKGIISPYELQTAKGNYEAAQSNLRQARAQLENARINLSYTNITSPTNGILDRITVREGSLISIGGAPLTTVSGFGDIWAYFSYDEKKVFQSVNRKSLNKENGNSKTEEQQTPLNNALLILPDGTTYKHKGTLEKATGIIDRATGSIQLKVVFPNPDHEVMTGSSGTVRFLFEYPGSIQVPQSATIEMQDKIIAYVVGDDNKVSSVALEIEGHTENDYVVKNLKPGTSIVLEGVNKLTEGEVITPKFE